MGNEIKPSGGFWGMVKGAFWGVSKSGAFSEAWKAVSPYVIGALGVVGTAVVGIVTQAPALAIIAAACIAFAALAFGMVKLQSFLEKRRNPDLAIPSSGAVAEIPIWKAVEHVRAVIGDNDEDDCYPESRRQLRQAAERGRITLFGRKELPPPKAHGFASEIWTEIEKTYWQDHQLNALATGALFDDNDHTMPEPLVVDGYRQRYWSVRVRKGEIEAVWPRSANVGFDTTFHHLVRYVAVESKWAGAFKPNDSPHYLVQLHNDPWDALKREVCGPLAEGRLNARGILWPRNAPKERETLQRKTRLARSRVTFGRRRSSTFGIRY